MELFSRIDAHVHFPADTPQAQQIVRDAHLKVVNVCVDDQELGGVAAQRQWYRALAIAQPELFAWITSFDLRGFPSPQWNQRVLEQLLEDFTGEGAAVGCKIWKNIGMELRDPATNQWVFIDDARFDPIFSFLQQQRKAVLMHIGEPLACWQELDPASPHYGYYSTQPQWHWYGRSDVPSHARLIASRDAIAQRYPHLTVVGAHYGSLESDLTEIAARFERYPNFFVDTSGRLVDMALQAGRDRQKVRELFLRYSDRLIWGTDPVCLCPLSQMDEQTRQARQSQAQRLWAKDWRFFATNDELNFNGAKICGLALPEKVLRKLFVDNARRIYVGV